ncbi:MAG: serine--tRNA ligase [Candidatus Doudnabacteria bacterium]|nr:serine--tRNA ligase [bacterium]MDZ4243514.1 serine--tRNA ligase [Candidatus Doudnabacteria bacterium]
MLDIKFIRENQEAVRKAVKDKGIDLDLDKLLAVDERRRKLTVEIDELRRQRRAIAQSRDIEKGKAAKQKLGALESELEQTEKDFGVLMLVVPNIPSPETPVGVAAANKEIYKWGEITKFDFEPKSHAELGKALDVIDFERGAKVSGFRGYFLKNEGVLLQLGVLFYALTKVISRGFTPVVPPVLVREFALVGSGHFPFGKDEVYQIGNLHSLKEQDEGTKDKMYLAGTSEPSLLAYYTDEILDEKDLPIRFCGISACYRSEVGSYGKDTKGLYRVHEFMKVEQVVLCKNDLAETKRWLMELESISKEILQDLRLPYRVIINSTGDQGAGKYEMHDIETWMPSRKAYGETHSNSALTDWQARRLNIRYRDRQGKLHFVHTLNNTAIASPRILIAILENYQQKDGSVQIPDVLQGFVGKKEIKPK